jgi:hypothetical protein
MNEKMREYITKIQPQWRPFLEKLADTVHAHNPKRRGWGPEDESWANLVNHLDGIAAAYVAWQGARISLNEHGAVDDARILELIEPCGLSEADQRVFVSACQQCLRDWRELQRKISDEAENENDAPK